MKRNLRGSVENEVAERQYAKMFEPGNETCIYFLISLTLITLSFENHFEKDVS